MRSSLRSLPGLIALGLVVTACGDTGSEAPVPQLALSTTTTTLPQSTSMATTTSMVPPATIAPTTTEPTTPPRPDWFPAPVEGTWVEFPIPEGIAYGVLRADETLWVPGSGTLTEVDPESGEVLNNFDVLPDEDLFGAAYAFESLWVSDFEGNVVRRIDPESGEVLAEIATGTNPEGLLAHADSMWVADHRGGTLTRIDPATNTVVATVEVGSAGAGGPARMAADGDRLWVGIPRSARLVAVDVNTNTVAAELKVPPSSVPCGQPVVHAGLIVMSSCFDNSQVAIVDTAGGTEGVTIDMGGFGGDPVVRGDLVYIPITAARGYPAALVAIDPVSAEIRHLVDLKHRATTVSLVEAFGYLWTTDEDSGTLMRIEAEGLPTS